MQSLDFPSIFEALTETKPFPWQTALFYRFIAVTETFPASASIPTGLGKTSIVAIWLLALALHPSRVPRRLIYVVNRRTVVDQTTAEVERLRNALREKPELAEIRTALTSLCALPLPTADSPPLAISTLRGQFADNGEWCADPARPAVVIGTVDMIGSGLLFSRYTRGFKTRPLHAGFLGQDVLLVHDEAHLEPSFQTLLEGIVTTQKTGSELRALHVIALTATQRAAIENGAAPFTLTDADRDNETVKKRINAVKGLSLVPLREDEKLDAKLVMLGKAKSAGRAVLVFTRSVEAALKVATELDKGEHKGKIAMLTGTMRGEERDNLVAKNPVFQRFLPEKDRAENLAPATGTAFLVATSAGEVGVNLSADDLVCDLSTYESMAQRFGRVNRFGVRDDSEITVVHETKFDTAKPIEAARERTLALLEKLGGSASPASLDALPAESRAAAFSPPPKLRVATEVQFDAWALTSVREPIAARSPIAPYLHGEAEWQPPETHLAWRDDRDFEYVADDAIEEFLETFPLFSRELLRDTTDRISETLGELVASSLQQGKTLPNAWLIDEFGGAEALPLAPFALSAKSRKDRTKAEEEELKRVKELLSGATLLLPVSLGGLNAMGMFSSSAKFPASDCSGIERRERDTREAAADFSREISNEDADESRYVLWFAPVEGGGLQRKTTIAVPETLAAHTDSVVANAAAIAAKMLPSARSAGEPDLGRCLVAAARLHDLGKNRAQWQRNLGNRAYDPANPDTILAKAGGKVRPRNVREHYRHEFGSLLDAERHPDFSGLSEAEREITLHIIAAHHGRARPHFSVDEAFDCSGNITAPVVATETPRRFARLQKRFGRWGLAWLESLLRAADYAASAGIVPQFKPAIEPDTATPSPTARPSDTPPPSPSATLVVNPANPGHYFACCGLFELAARRSPDALAWFEQTQTGVRFHLANTPSLTELLEKITAAEITALDPEDATASPIFIGAPFNLRVDWWKTAGAETSALKVWAGKMESPRIARAMQKAIRLEDGEKILSALRIAYVPEDPTTKVEPFYFDANRGPNSDARDVGFSTNDLGLETLAAPATEFLTLVGLQRAVPEPSGDRLFDYCLWATPIPITLLAAGINGLTESRPQASFRFESWYRTSQRKHKAFLPAKPL
jgi:CRISPR-associated endonuclease/helicase Cas3